jgi:hypothetical protein
MINRRKFVALLSLVPLVGKRMLLACLMPKDPPLLPPGYIQCDVCGEFNGSTDAVNLSWGDQFRPGGKISLTCLCHGVLCPRCKTTLIHRPISNTYYPEANEVWHWPYFAALAGCAKCRSKCANGRKVGCSRAKGSPNHVVRVLRHRWAAPK